MRVLVTGGSGFCGAHVVCALRQRGHDVLATVHSAPPGRDRLSIDLGAPRLAVLEGLRFDAVIHTAAAADTGWCEANPEAAEAINVKGTALLADLAALWKARFLHFSSDVIFDGLAPPYGEDALPTPLHAYGRTKVAGEEAVIARLTDAVILRPSLVYRRKEDRLCPARGEWIVDAVRQGRPVRLFTNQIRNPVEVGAVAGIVCRLVEDDSFRGVLHVGGEESLSRYAFGCLMLAHHGLPSDGVEAVAYRPGDLPLPTPVDLCYDLRRLRDLMGELPPGPSTVLAS